MASAKRDQNNVPTLIAASSDDGVTPIRVQVNSTSHGLLIDNNTTGSNFGVTNAVRDENFVPVLLAVSSTDGVTPVEVYADSTGHLLVNSA